MRNAYKVLILSLWNHSKQVTQAEPHPNLEIYCQSLVYFKFFIHILLKAIKELIPANLKIYIKP